MVSSTTNGNHKASSRFTFPTPHHYFSSHHYLSKTTSKIGKLALTTGLQFRYLLDYRVASTIGEEAFYDPRFLSPKSDESSQKDYVKSFMSAAAQAPAAGMQSLAATATLGKRFRNLPRRKQLPIDSSESTHAAIETEKPDESKNVTASTDTSEKSSSGGSTLVPDKDIEASTTDEQKIETLKKIVAQSSEVLASATTIFPLTLFRDDIVVDRAKVTITKRNFFFSKEVMSIRIEDILNVKVSVGPFFGSITLAVRVLSSEDHHSINYFWRKDATHLKHIIQGYIIVQHNNIDVSHQSKKELVKTLSELGHDTSR